VKPNQILVDYLDVVFGSGGVARLKDCGIRPEACRIYFPDVFKICGNPIDRPAIKRQHLSASDGAMELHARDAIGHERKNANGLVYSEVRSLANFSNFAEIR
jgi:hypothetical protein